jgi:uncharacterized protein (DUF433 family)/DNA-binding transcriptional MerR regulator
MTAADEELIAFPDATAARLARVPLGELRYWEETRLVVPSVRRQLKAGNTVRLYSFDNMLALSTAQLLTERGMSLEHIRRVIAHLGSLGYKPPRGELTFTIYGGGICFQHQDGSWDADLQPDQIVLVEAIRLEPLRACVSQAAHDRGGKPGQIVANPDVLGGKPIFAGTRIAVDTIQSYLDAGYDEAAILAEYPSLTPADIEAARHHAA